MKLVYLALAELFGWCAGRLNVGSRWFADLARSCRQKAQQ